MDPLAAVGAGRMAAGKRFAFYVSVQLASVLVPGLVAVTCLTALVLHAEHPADFGPAVGRAAQSVRGPAVFLLDVSWLASAYVVGYAGREVAFRLLGLAERLSTRHGTTLDTLHQEMEAAYGQAAVRRCLRTHPLLEHLLLSAHRTGGMTEALYQIGRMTVADAELILRGLPPVMCRRADPAIAARLRSMPVAST